MSISRSQAQAITDGFLDGLGSTRPAPGVMPIVEEVLSLAAEAFINNANENLRQSDAIATGELSTQLTFYVQQLGSTYELRVGYPKGSEAAKYYDFVNKGVQGLAGSGRAPGSPYKFKTPFASKKMAAAILKWYQQQGRGATSIQRPMSGLESKRKSIRDTISQADSLKAMAYATAVNIKKKGREATKYFDKAVTNSFGPEFIESMAAALSGEVRLQIRQINTQN